jgi:type IV pilus assembly protein PilY1
MNRNHLYAAGLALLGAALLPLRDGIADTCCTATVSGYDMKSSSLTRSLAAAVQQPVNGDEAFFNSTAVSGPTAPSSIVFLLDNSGSMNDLPQCDTNALSASWNNCPKKPTNPGNATNPVAGNSYKPVVKGTCDFSGATASWVGSNGAWMNAITPIATYADPGYDDGTGYLKDSPPWTATPMGTCNAAVNNNCMFQPTKAYQYASWDESTGTATPESGDGCTYYNGAAIRQDVYGNPLTAGNACTTCLASKGVYIFSIRWASSKNGSGVPTGYGDWTNQMRISGGWLNANPPKFISARKAIKTLLRIDPTSPKLRDKVRYGLASFWNSDASGNAVNNNNGGDSSGIAKGDGATLLVPLGPDCDTTTTAGYVQDRQAIIDLLNSTGTNRIRFRNYTPLGESLFNLAQYFSQPGATGAHDVRFTSTWDKKGTPGGISYWAGQDFRSCSPGAIGASWAGTCNADDTGTNSKQKSVCWSCQVSSAIIVTDGMPNNESGLPLSGVTSSHATNPNGSGKWDFQKWTPTAYASSSNCAANRGASGEKCGGSYLPLVAYYLNNYDIIPDTSFSGTQNVIVHAISFGISDSTALTTLQATANLGGGKFANATSTADLEDALVKAVNNVVSRQTAFASANANALQTNRNQATETYFARFKPDTTPSWQGHLIQGILFDEFAMGCDPTKKYAEDTSTVPCGSTTNKPNFNGDTDADGNNRCDGVFLVDQNCKEMTERGTDGAFVLADDIDTLATVPWDAGAVLCNPNGAYVGATNPCTAVNASYVSAADDATKEPTPTGKPIRKIYTWLGSTGLTEFKTTDATGLSALEKAMSLDQPFCQQLLTDAAACVSGVCHTSASWVQADTDQCAKLVIYYVRGFDVFDLDGNGCRSPVNSTSCTNGQERAWKLGDIFHSTPAVVKPPAHEDLCDSGYDNQCVATIHSPSWLGAVTPQTTMDYPTTGVDAYAAWRNANVDRQRVVLVGANDGMLHAFDAGSGTGTTRDSFGSLPYTAGTGKELWAFIPPDLLPRLKFLLYGHQYMVDGSTMVRDVWVDGGATGASTKDAIKQQNEFHTLAVVAERSGGTQFVGLDVTDPVNPPKFLWTFPPPCSDDARWVAESWTDFAPRAPPIGPVRIKSTAARGFDEKWVVMLNGGYDPAMVKGRAVFMVDAWSGATVWRFTADDVKTLKNDSTTPASMFPVPASVGMVDIGDPGTATFSRDGFFDTATWGDMGGNLWVARFWDAGDASSGLVSNWFAARAFEEQRRASDDKMMVNAAGAIGTPPAQVRSPFFYMTANAWESQTHSLRTFVGSGNREQMMQKGAECGPDNVSACIQSGCSKVETKTVDNFGACTETQDLLFQGGQYVYTSSTSGTCGTSTLVCAAPTSNVYTGTTTFDFTCGGTTHSTITGTLTCNASGVCTNYQQVGSGNLFTAGLTDAQFHDRFYGIWSYGGRGDALKKKTFMTWNATGNYTGETQAAARAYDDLRFSDVAVATKSCGGGTSGADCRLVDVTHAAVTYDPDNPTGTVDNGTIVAKAIDPGWFYEYGQVCQQSSCDPAPPWTDERTASGANVVLGCAAWSGFRPTASTGSPGPGDVCTAVPASTSSYSYLSDFITGLPSLACGFASNGTVYRSYERNTWSPPNTASARVTFNAQGQVSYSVLNLDPGQPPGHTTIGVQEVGADPVYQLEVTHDAHQCRHVDSASCE